MQCDVSDGGSGSLEKDIPHFPMGKQMVFIELCAGSAVLSAAAQKHGFRVVPVDYKRNRHKPKCKLVSLDLSEDHAWDVLMYVFETCDVVAVHLAPPCGILVAKRVVSLCLTVQQGLNLFDQASVYLGYQTFRSLIQ